MRRISVSPVAAAAKAESESLRRIQESGRLAFVAGIPRVLSPFSRGSAARQAWSAGWGEGERHARRNSLRAKIAKAAAPEMAAARIPEMPTALRALRDVEFKSIAHHLRVAAMRYRRNAESVCVPTVIENFKAQAVEADALAELFEEAAHERESR